MPEERGPLLATFSDGTQIYKYGILDSRGFVNMRVGLFNIGSEFNPNVGVWEEANVVSALVSTGNRSLEISVDEITAGISIGGELASVDIGIIFDKNGNVIPVFGASFGTAQFGISAGFRLYENATDNLSTYNTITISPNGNVIVTKFSPGDPEYPYVRVDTVIYDVEGNIIGEYPTNIPDPAQAADMAAGIWERTPHCFTAGTLIRMADGSEKPIEAITTGDQVLAFDANAQGGRGGFVPARVVQTFIKHDQKVIDFHGVKVTPGHVFLNGEGKFQKLEDILRNDGSVVLEDGLVVSARTGRPVNANDERPLSAVGAAVSESAVQHVEGSGTYKAAA
jgi:hypothetical protein